MLNIYTFISFVRSVRTTDLFLCKSYNILVFSKLYLFFYSNGAILKSMISS